MLIATIIRQTVSLQGLKIESVEENNCTIIARLAPNQRFKLLCGVCKSAGIYRDMRKTRYFRHVPIWGYPVFFVYSPRRVRCRACGAVRVEHIAVGCRQTPSNSGICLFYCNLGQIVALAGSCQAFQLRMGNSCICC